MAPALDTGTTRGTHTTTDSSLAPPAIDRQFLQREQAAQKLLDQPLELAVRARISELRQPNQDPNQDAKYGESGKPLTEHQLVHLRQDLMAWAAAQGLTAEAQRTVGRIVLAIANPSATEFSREGFDRTLRESIKQSDLETTEQVKDISSYKKELNDLVRTADPYDYDAMQRSVKERCSGLKMTAAQIEEATDFADKRWRTMNREVPEQPLQAQKEYILKTAKEIHARGGSYFDLREQLVTESILFGHSKGRDGERRLEQTLEKADRAWKQVNGSQSLELKPSKRAELENVAAEAFSDLRQLKQTEAAQKGLEARAAKREAEVEKYIRLQDGRIKTHEDAITRKEADIKKQIARAEERHQDKKVKSLQQELDKYRADKERTISDLKKEKENRLKKADFHIADHEHAINIKETRAARISAAADKHGNSDLDRVLAIALKKLGGQNPDALTKEALVKAISREYFKDRAMSGELIERTGIGAQLINSAAQRDKEVAALDRRIKDANEQVGRLTIGTPLWREGLAAKQRLEEERSELVNRAANLRRNSEYQNAHQATSTDEAVTSIANWVADKGVLFDVAATAERTFDQVYREKAIKMVEGMVRTGATFDYVQREMARMENNLGVKLDKAELEHMFNDRVAAVAAQQSEKIITTAVKMGMSLEAAQALAEKQTGGRITDPVRETESRIQIDRVSAERAKRVALMSRTRAA